MLEGSVFLGLAVLTVCAGAVIRWRVLKRTGQLGARLSDADIRGIEEQGTLAMDDDPLDLDEVREAEERFWQETWEEDL
ncbi:MAG: hypothetical protein ACR2QM_06965 [Longimicrobiales bacterium]